MRYLLRYGPGIEQDVVGILDSLGLETIFRLSPIGAVSFEADDGFDTKVFDRVNATAWPAQELYTLDLKDEDVSDIREYNLTTKAETAISTPIGIIDHGVCSRHAALVSIKTHLWIDGAKNFIDANVHPSPNDVAHGTFVTGIASGLRVGVAPAAPTHIIEAGQVTLEDAFYNSMLVFTHKSIRCRVINISLYAPQPIKLQDNIFKYVRSQGALPVVASGNSANKVVSPADSPYAFSVGYCAHDGTILQDSGSELINGIQVPPVVALGLQVESAYTQTCSPPYNLFTRSSGTSYAAPFVTGLAAVLFHVCPNATPDQIQEAICVTCAPVKTPNKCRFGMVDPAAALRYVQMKCSRATTTT